MKNFIWVFCLIVSVCQSPSKQPITVGAMQLENYLEKLKGKRVGLVINHTSMVKSQHLLDTLLAQDLNIEKIFTPEHGFKGTKSNGENIENEAVQSKISVVSLYGKNKKPSSKQLEGIDIMVFDIQDVGARFYTYISTMHYVMESCAENNIPLLILDRPNPNGNYVDGPVLDTTLRSFVGLHPIPIVHGMTIGELALMINGEQWLGGGAHCTLEIIPVKGWQHDMPYSLPVQPSPNLPNDLSIRLYPSLCLFEGSIMSVGRGTDFPFQQVGHPSFPNTSYAFIPMAKEGAKNPPYEDKRCYGIKWDSYSANKGLTLQPLITCFKKMGNDSTFFNSYFDKLAGTTALKKQIMEGMSEKEIKKTWKKGLNNFKKIREKYLLYD